MTACDSREVILRETGPLHWRYTEGLLASRSKYPTPVFHKAARLYTMVKIARREKEVAPCERGRHWKRPHFTNFQENQQVLELVFGALLYGRVYETVLDRQSFFYRYPQLQKESDLVIVVFHDMRGRKLLPGISDFDPQDHLIIRNIENAILNMRLKLGAELSRVRIEERAATFEQLSPPELRRFCAACSLQAEVMGWVNTAKSTISQVNERLREAHCSVCEVDRKNGSPVDMPDVLSCSAKSASQMMSNSVVLENQIVLQDIGGCLGPHCLVNTLLQQIRSAQGEDYVDPRDRKLANLLNLPCPPPYPKLGRWDIAVTEVGSGMTAAHLACLLQAHGCLGTVLAFGALTSDEHQRLESNIFNLGIKGVRVVLGNITDFSVDDVRLENVRSVFVNPKCSCSAVRDPIRYLCSEEGDIPFLRDLCDKEKRGDFFTSQQDVLSFCLKLPRVHTVIYMTHSMDPAENDEVVQAAMKDANESKALSSPESDDDDVDEMEVRNIIPPFQFDVAAIPVNPEGLVPRSRKLSPYLKIEPQDCRNGCFVAAIARKVIPELDIEDDSLSTEESDVDDLYSWFGSKHTVHSFGHDGMGNSNSDNESETLVDNAGSEISMLYEQLLRSQTKLRKRRRAKRRKLSLQKQCAGLSSQIPKMYEGKHTVRSSVRSKADSKKILSEKREVNFNSQTTKVIASEGERVQRKQKETSVVELHMTEKPMQELAESFQISKGPASTLRKKEKGSISCKDLMVNEDSSVRSETKQKKVRLQKKNLEEELKLVQMNAPLAKEGNIEVNSVTKCSELVNSSSTSTFQLDSGSSNTLCDEVYTDSNEPRGQGNIENNEFILSKERDKVSKSLYYGRVFPLPVNAKVHQKISKKEYPLKVAVPQLNLPSSYTPHYKTDCYIYLHDGYLN